MMSKALKIIRNIIITVVLMIIAAVLVCFILKVFAKHQWKDTLEKDGLVNMVSAGDYQMNLNVFGNESAENTVVAMPGGADAAFPVYMKMFSEHLDDSIRLAVVSRPGYGVSEETKADVTVEYIVDSTREALKNAGLEGPYILMPHSFSGIYATYWENTYPDEISGVLFLDTVNEATDTSGIEAESEDKLYNVLSNLGILRLLLGDTVMYAPDFIPEEYADDYMAFYNYNDSTASPSLLSEIFGEYSSNAEKAWTSVKSNDIPKIYISTDPENISDMKEIMEFSMPADEISVQTVAEYFEEFFSDEQKNYRTERSRFLNKLGNCTEVNIPSDHFVFAQRPDETAEQLNILISKIK